MSRREWAPCRGGGGDGDDGGVGGCVSLGLFYNACGVRCIEVDAY